MISIAPQRHECMSPWRHARRALLAIASVVLASVLYPMQPAHAAIPTPRAISWLAAGDSYSSGEGLPHYDGSCVQASNGSGSEVWSYLAYEKLKSAEPNLDSPVLVACTGAKMNQFLDKPDKAGTPEFNPSTHKPYDLVTFTFGGDDADFSKVIYQCLGISIYWPSDPGLHRCPANSIVRSLIARNVGAPYPEFLNAVAKRAVVTGGNIVVLGYPDLIEDPKFWPTLDRDLHICMGIQSNDAQLIRGWAGDLNATIGSAVSTFDAEPASQRNGVDATFVDVNTGQPASASGIKMNDPNLFEPSAGPRHNICSAQSWLNGITSIDHLNGSFHPKQQGQAAMGALAAEVIKRLNWTHLRETTTTPTSTSACDPSQLFAAAEAYEHFSSNDPRYAGVSPAPGAYAVVCDGNYAWAAVSRPNVGTTDGGTVFESNGSGTWREIGQTGGSDAACQLVQLGIPRNVALVLSNGVRNSPMANCVLAPNSPSTSDTSGSTPTLIVPLENYQSFYKPLNLYFSGDSTNVVLNITWTMWTASQAIGQGTWNYLSCSPSCAGGPSTPYPATIVLSHPVNGAFTALTETTSGPHGFTKAYQYPTPWVLYAGNTSSSAG